MGVTSGVAEFAKGEGSRLSPCYAADAPLTDCLVRGTDDEPPHTGSGHACDRLNRSSLNSFQFLGMWLHVVATPP